MKQLIFYFSTALVILISPNSNLWANDIAPPCDTIVLVSGEKIVATILTQTDSELTIENCENQISQTLSWNDVEVVRRWVKKRKSRKKSNSNLSSKVKREYYSKLEVVNNADWYVGYGLGGTSLNYSNIKNDIISSDEIYAVLGSKPSRVLSYPVLMFSIDRIIRNNMSIGFRISHIRQSIQKRVSSNCFIYCPPRYATQVSLTYTLLQSKIEATIPSFPIAFHIGPAINLIKDNRFEGKDINKGFFVGISLRQRLKRSIEPYSSLNLYIEYHHQEKYWLRTEDYDPNVDEISGMELPLSHLQIGIELGFSFKKRQK